LTFLKSTFATSPFAAGWAAKIQTESAAGAVFAKSKGAGLKKGILAHLQKSIAGKKTSGA
jgi:hypothetical protein